MPSNNDYPPLVTDASPSYARAQRQNEHPSPPEDAERIALLARLSEIEENVSQAYRQAASVLHNQDLVLRASEERAPYEAHREVLSTLIETLGGSAPTPDECRDVLPHAATDLKAGMDDDAIMHILDRIRTERGAAYDEALRSSLFDVEQRDVLARLAEQTSAG